MNRNQNKNKKHFLTTARAFVLLLSFALLLPVVFSYGLVALGYTARLTGNSDVRVGDSFTLRLALDGGAYGFQGVLEYDSSVLAVSTPKVVNYKYQKNFQWDADSGLIVLTHNTPVTQLLNLTFHVRDDAEVGSSTTIRVHSGEVLNESSSVAFEEVTFTANIVDTKSSDASLDSLQITTYKTEKDDNGFMPTLNPAFDGDTKIYSATVPNEYAFYRISADPNDSGATVKTVLEGDLQEGMNTIPVVVVAEDGTEMEYTIMLFRERTPEISEVEPDESSAESDVTSEEPEPSEDPSEEPSGNEDSSEESGVGDVSEESDFSDGTNTESTVETSSDVGMSVSTSSESNLFKPYQPEENNWTGIIIGIVALGGVCIVALVIRLYMLYRKKQGI